jgi:Fic family protein
MATHDRPAGLDIRRADAEYRSFPSFRDWLSSTSIDTVRWDRYARLLQQRAELTPELLARAREVAKRAAAVDTGAIEGLYDVDRGFTFSVAMQMATWEAQLDAKGSRVRSIIEAQLGAYDFVLDFATQAVPVAEAWIRTLHEVMCRGQEIYSVYTEVGLQEQALPLGRYKVLSNHVLKSNGTTHSYAPVDLVPAEMQRFCAELRTPEFEAAHPVLQASYSHYALVVIHPFADGNGRVARALASVFTYRALSVPLLILAEHRSEYYAGLESADAGDLQPFVDFTLSRTLDSIQLVSDTLKAAGVPAPIEAAAQLKRVFLTRGGFTHGEVDDAGYRMVDAFFSEVQRQGNSLNIKELSIEYSNQQTLVDVSNADYRAPLTSGPRLVLVTLQTSPPARVKLIRRVTLEVPKDSGKEDDLVLRCVETGEALESRITEAHPVVTGTLQLRLAVFAHGVLGRAIAELTKMASGNLRQHGY